MTQVWPDFGVAPLPALISLICRPDDVVTETPPLCAAARDDKSRQDAPSAIAITANAARFVIVTGFVIVILSFAPESRGWYANLNFAKRAVKQLRGPSISNVKFKTGILRSYEGDWRRGLVKKR